MILRFCEQMGLICHIFHVDAKKRNLIASYKPPIHDSHTRKVEFFVRDSHCFWYGKLPEEMGKDKRPGSSNAISNFFGESFENEEDLGVGADAEEYDDCFKEREVEDVHRQDKAPPFDEWKHQGELMDAAPEFKPFLITKKRGLNKDRNTPRVYFLIFRDLEDTCDKLSLIHI